VVRAGEARRAALVDVGERMRSEAGVAVLGYAASGLPGPAGNRESFIWLAEAGRAGEVQDLELAARMAEP
jgi:23S rRNA (cytidine1920-2'-O)/16S rRNA (cytidine1409-2'-O)-methyltransferase